MQRFKRAVFDAGRAVNGDSEGGETPGLVTRWHFDMPTALILSLTIIVCTVVLMWSASASPASSVDSMDSQSAGIFTHEETRAPAGGQAPVISRGHKLIESGGLVGDSSKNIDEGGDGKSSDQTQSSDKQRAIFVHIAGQVHNPGVVTVHHGARVFEAIEAAGGVTEQADTTSVNLAAQLTDGDYVYIPSREEVANAVPGLNAPHAPSASSSGNGKRTGAGKGGCVNLNAATAEEIEELPGVGPALSQRIVEYRDEHGPFSTVEDLDSVSGIGIRMVNKIREQVCLS